MEVWAVCIFRFCSIVDTLGMSSMGPCLWFVYGHDVHFHMAPSSFCSAVMRPKYAPIRVKDPSSILSSPFSLPRGGFFSSASFHVCTSFASGLLWRVFCKCIFWLPRLREINAQYGQATSRLGKLRCAIDICIRRFCAFFPNTHLYTSPSVRIATYIFYFVCGNCKLCCRRRIFGKEIHLYVFIL